MPGLPNPNFAAQVDWNLLRLFAEIVKAGGIGAAARRLNKQQPTMSAALKRLEGHAGARLLDRGANGVELTPAGRALYRLCEDMAEAARAAPHHIAQALQQVSGLVRIQVVSSIVSAEFDAAIASLHARHPAIRIEIRVSPWREVLDVLERGEAELGVGTDSGVHPGLTYEPLFSETQQLYCARTSPLFGTRVATMASLREEGFVLTGHDEVEAITHLRQRYRLGTVVTGLAEDLHEAQRLIRLGAGIGFLPTLAAARAVQAGELWPLLPEDIAPSYPMYLLTRQTPERGTPAQLFLDEITRHLRGRVKP